MISEIALTLLFFLLISVFCWVLVFKKSLRERLEKGAWRFYRINSEGEKEAYDAMYLAGALVMAVTFTVAFLFGLVLAFIKLVGT